MIEQETSQPSRSGTALIVLVCLAGVAVALFLVVTEAREGEALRVSEVEHRIQDGTVVAEGVVTNHSDKARCPDIRVAARDGESRDLAEVEARPAGGEARIDPDEGVRYTATIDGLTAAELEEQLDDVSMYVYEPHECEPER